jgi:pimeloyl-ACP methyl ester carboxylesterase
MPTALIDGITTRYEVVGSGPPLLMYSPAGFDATLDKWTTQGVYARIKLLVHLPEKYTCIVFDRRECGQSGGRVEPITWAHYVAQGKGLLDHLKIKRAHLMGGCMGCCPVVAFGVAYPEMAQSMILFWPVGGAKYRISTHKRFADHLAYVEQHGLAGVVSLVTQEGKPFNAEPRGGPWASVIKNDRAFAEAYAKMDLEKYKKLVADMCRTLFDRDTSPGAGPEDMLRSEIPALVIPGHDASHATSAARYLEECLPKAEYWDVLPEAQTEETTSTRLLEFLQKASAAGR